MKIVLSLIATAALMTGLAHADSTAVPSPAPVENVIFSPEAPISDASQAAQVAPLTEETVEVAPATTAAPVPVPELGNAPAQPVIEPATTRTSAAPAVEGAPAVGADYTFSLE